MLKPRKWLNFFTPPLFGPRLGKPLESRDEIWRQKTRIVGLPDSEESMTLLSSFCHNTGVWQTDGQTRCSHRDPC